MRPPLGVMPKTIWLTKRLEDLDRAILEYMAEDLEVSIDWVKERNELLIQLNK